MPTVRASALTSYADCYRRGTTTSLSREEQKRWGFDPSFDAPTISAIMGTLLHKAAEDNEQDLRDKLYAHSGDIRFDKTTPDLDTAARQCARMLRELHTKRPDWREADLLECEWEATIDGVRLTGHPDRVRFIGDHELDVHDLKTSAWPPGAKHSAQMGGYALLAFLNLKRKPVTGHIHHLPRTVMSKPQAPMSTVIFPLDPCAREARRIIKAIAANKGKAPNNLPCNPSSTLCRKQWCQAYGTPYCEISRIMLYEESTLSDITP